MGYTSFSENKVSAFLVFNYLLYIVLVKSSTKNEWLTKLLDFDLFQRYSQDLIYSIAKLGELVSNKISITIYSLLGIFHGLDLG